MVVTGKDSKADEKSKRAMDGLASALREVATEASTSNEKHAQDSMALTTSKDHVTGHTRTALTANAMSVDMDDMISEVTYGIKKGLIFLGSAIVEDKL
ncbi:hypothetical protein Tco_1575838 [Tanacetum coccineum]